MASDTLVSLHGTKVCSETEAKIMLEYILYDILIPVYNDYIYVMSF